MVTRSLLRAGDSVLVDEPGWAVEYARLAALGMRVLPVPRGDDGPDLAVMQRLIEAHRPRLYVTVSVLHNPTGASLSLHVAHRLLQLAQAHDLHIVEDDTYAHLRQCAPAAAGGARRTGAHGLHLGFFEDPGAELARRLSGRAGRAGRSARRHQAADHPDHAGLTELALAHCLEQGLLRRHAERVTSGSTSPGRAP